MYGLSLLFFFVFETCDEIMILNMVQYEMRNILFFCFCLSVSLISFFFLYARVLVVFFGSLFTDNCLCYVISSVLSLLFVCGIVLHFYLSSFFFWVIAIVLNIVHYIVIMDTR